MTILAFSPGTGAARTISLPASVARVHRPPARRRVTREHVLVGLLLLGVGIVHGVNMFHFPYYDTDEGTYVAQARAFAQHSRLAPYTYWYDHAPAGWILIGAWARLTGGFATFGTAIDSGRALMLVLHLGSSLAIYVFVRRVTARPWAAALAVAAFSFAPHGIYFQRRVLLDNIAVFWFLCALAVLPHRTARLGRCVLSAALLGVAILSKESMLFVAPACLLLGPGVVKKSQRLLARLLYVSVCGCVVSLYFLYAALKGELFPTGTLLGGSTPHVSLLGSLAFQSSRQAGGSPFSASLAEWWTNDPVWLVLCLVAGIALLLLAVRSSAARLVAGCLVGYWAYLLHGGLVLDFYVVPLYALAALALGLCVGLPALPRRGWSRLPAVAAVTVVVGCVAAMLPLGAGSQLRQNLFTDDQTKAQKDAYSWLATRTDARLVAVDADGYSLMQDAAGPVNAQWYLKLDLDPQARHDKAHDDSATIDYLVVTRAMKADLARYPFTEAAMRTSRRLRTFSSGGYDVEVWANETPARQLRSAWRSYVDRFIKDGRVVDPQSGGMTTSEGQAYALLRAVWSDDRSTFDTVLRWSNDHLTTTTGLWRWRWSPGAGPVEANSATDADTDAALALILAGRHWGSEQYTSQARSIVAALWHNDVTRVRGLPVMTAGPWAHPRGSATLNPSYFSPAAYREFAKLDAGHPWGQVTGTSLAAIRGCAAAGLPTDWCTVDAAGHYTRSTGSATAPSYGYDAFRLPWRLALDWLWSKDPRTLAAARVLQPLVDRFRRDGGLAATYTPNGEPVQSNPSAAAAGGDLGAFVLLDPSDEDRVYDTGLAAQFGEDSRSSWWQQPDNYYTQNWAWFGAALHARSLSSFS
jgi:endo-1,4-beta-D-glucanase Y/4-amino-4-deoxy-L-arabinose transferase-like glycosyltransferase